MNEQLDLFFASVTEQDIQEKHDEKYKQQKLTTRQWELLNFIKRASFLDHKKVTQKDICDYMHGYEYNDDPNCHDHCPAIWKDIKDINLSYESDKIIISKNFEYWIGNEEETQEFLDQLWNDLEPRLMRYWAYLKKAERNGQGQLLSRKLEPIDENSKARAFVESYGETRISGD